MREDCKIGLETETIGEGKATPVEVAVANVILLFLTRKLE